MAGDIVSASSGLSRRYSDRLLELRVKGLLPQYREGSRVALTNIVSTGAPGEIQAQFKAALERLSMTELEELETLMMRGVELLTGKPATISLDLHDDANFALIEHGLGAAIQINNSEAELCSAR